MSALKEENGWHDLGKNIKKMVIICLRTKRLVQTSLFGSILDNANNMPNVIVYDLMKAFIINILHSCRALLQSRSASNRNATNNNCNDKCNDSY